MKKEHHCPRNKLLPVEVMVAAAGLLENSEKRMRRLGKQSHH